ncbi:MAG: response regulator [Limisphaerales bacterium]
MKKHILLIDDEAPIREILTRALTAEGYRISAAGTVAEAQRVVQQDPPDLIISDLQMEDGDGLALAAQWKQEVPTVPVMLLTGVIFDPDVVQQNLSQKVSAYLAKTTPLKRILEEVRRLLTEPRPERPSPA